MSKILFAFQKMPAKIDKVLMLEEFEEK